MRTGADLLKEVIAADFEISKGESQVFDSMVEASSDGPEVNEHILKPVGDLDPEQCQQLLVDMGFIAACDGYLDPKETSVILRRGKELGVSQVMIEDILSTSSALAKEARENTEKLTDACDPNTEAATLSALLIAGLSSSVEFGKDTAESIAKSEVEGEVKQQLAQELAEAGFDGAAECIEDVVSDIPLVAVYRTVAKAKSGDFSGAAGEAATGAAKKTAAVAGGAAAGAAAGSLAYAGVGGTLLQGAVALGLAAPPTAVVVAPVVGGAVGALALGRLLKLRREKED